MKKIGCSIAPAFPQRFRKALWLALAWVAVLLFAPNHAVRADGPPPSAPFDLVGPSVHVKVTRAGGTLPIANVASLRAGDRLWVEADLPSDQTAHYVLVVAFLQGPTNPPPENWFTQIETWRKDVREHGSIVIVPDNAQQALLFLVPETGGGFASLRATVRGKPGTFVRAAEDLEQASLDRSRLDKFLEEVRKPYGAGPASLAQRSALLSRTLAVKADPECFDRPIDEQSSCLTQNTSGLTLQETPYQSMVATLTSGASADLVGTFGASPIAKAGYYSPYIGSAMDIVRLLNGLHTAAFQYLPALVSPTEDELNLKLNAPPSFRTPRSVLVIGLPGVAPPALPSLRAVKAKQVYCLQNSALVLPVEGAPLVFSTGMAHDFVVALQDKFGRPIDVPAFADAALGGFRLDTDALPADRLDAGVTGTLRGSWGFQPYEGPTFHFKNARPAKWMVPPADAGALLVGREDVLHLESDEAACVESVSVEMESRGATGVANPAEAESDKAKPDEIKVDWKIAKPGEIVVRVSLNQQQEAGGLRLSVRQFGMAGPDVVTAPAYAEAAHLDHFLLNSGDSQGVLTGERLDEVAGFELNGVQFLPARLSAAGGKDSLELHKSAAGATALPVGRPLVAHVTLKDGRVLQLQTDVRSPRPKVALLSKSVKVGAAPSGVRLGNEDELPQDGQLSFLLTSEAPFPHTEQIEVSTSDGSANWLLSLANGGLVLQDSRSVLATLDPLKNLGPSAFGPLQFRPVDDQGQKGDWQPLARLVRIPTLQDIHCPESEDKPCVLSGSNLFLLDSVSADSAFTNPVSVPPGYAAASLSVPRPNGALLYIKLRDDPTSVDTVALPVFPDAY